MAVANKNIPGTVSISGRGYSFWLICKESDVNNTNNTSDVTVEAHIKSTTTRTSTSGWTFSITINGKEYKETSKTLDNYGGGSIATNTDVKVYSKTYDNVPHNPDGTKTVNVSCTLSKSSYGSYDPGKCTASGTYTLTSIPRMKNPSVGSNPTINEEEVSGSTVVNTTPVTISTNSQASNFRFTIQILDGSTVVEPVATGVSYTTSWTPTLANYASRIPGASKQFTIKSTGTSGVTGTGTCNVTVGIARTNITAPTTSSNQVSYSDINTMPTSMAGLLIQSKSRLSFLVGQTCYTGASPAAAGIRIENQSKTSTTLSGNNIIVDMDSPIQGYGTIKAYGNVRDSRGFRYINSSDQNDWVELKSFTVYKYKQPTFESDPVISRVNANGTPDDQGEYLAYSMNARVSAVRVSGTNKNSATFKVKYKVKGSSDPWTECSFTGTYDSTNDDIVYNVSDIKLKNNGTDVHISASTAYEIEFELDDAFNYGQSSDTKIVRTSTITVGGDLLNFNVNGHAMAIGQLSTATQNEEKLEIAYPTDLKNDVNMQGDLNVQGDLNIDNNGTPLNVLENLYKVTTLWEGTFSSSSTGNINWTISKYDFDVIRIEYKMDNWGYNSCRFIDVPNDKTDVNCVMLSLIYGFSSTTQQLRSGVLIVDETSAHWDTTRSFYRNLSNSAVSGGVSGASANTSITVTGIYGISGTNMVPSVSRTSDVVDLYANTSGSKTEITLADAASNYNFLEIFYGWDSGAFGVQSIRYDTTCGYTINLSQIVYNNNRVYWGTSRWTVSGSKLTPAGEYWSIATSGNASRTQSNNMAIFKVIGYR